MNDRSIFNGDLDCPTDQEQLEKTIDAIHGRTCDDSDADFVETLFKKYKELQIEIDRLRERAKRV